MNRQERFLLIYELLKKAKMPKDKWAAHELLEACFNQVEDQYVVNNLESKMIVPAIGYYNRVKGTNWYHNTHSKNGSIISVSGEILIFDNSFTKVFDLPEKTIIYQIANNELYFAKTRRFSSLRRIITKNPTYPSCFK